MLRLLRTFARFWFDFVVGDDWRIAAGVVVLVAGGGWLVNRGTVGTRVLAVGIAAAIVVLVAASILLDARRMRAAGTSD